LINYGNGVSLAAWLPGARSVRMLTARRLGEAGPRLVGYGA